MVKVVVCTSLSWIRKEPFLFLLVLLPLGAPLQTSLWSRLPEHDGIVRFHGESSVMLSVPWLQLLWKLKLKSVCWFLLNEFLASERSL